MKAILALGAAMVLLGAGCATTERERSSNRRPTVNSSARICAPSSSRARRGKRACAT